jgi:hypothetical protein
MSVRIEIDRWRGNVEERGSERTNKLEGFIEML